MRCRISLIAFWSMPPCTGQSLVGRGKQSLSAFSEHQVAHSAARQQSILESALELVRPGGRLVYSTCTFAFAENEGIVHWLRERLPDWQPVVFDELAQWQTPGFAGCYRLCRIAIAALRLCCGSSSPRPVARYASGRITKPPNIPVARAAVRDGWQVPPNRLCQ